MTSSSPGRAAARPYAPASALPGGKRDHPDDDKTDVGVDAVLSADVGDAPMRQRQVYRVESNTREPPSRSMAAAERGLRGRRRMTGRLAFWRRRPCCSTTPS